MGEARRKAHAGAIASAGRHGPKIIAIVLAAVFYNAVLAFANAHGISINRAMVAITEGIVLAAALMLVVSSGRRSIDSAGFALFAFFLGNALLVSLLSGALFVDMARNGAIIVLFMLLGSRIDQRTLKACFLIVSVLIAACLVLELVSVKSYAALLQPGTYFAQTRGIALADIDELGLFRNAVWYEGRFAISSISNHRTASLFLEQVSLANFSTVLVIYLVAMWKRIHFGVRAFYIGLIALILLSNNTRAGLALAIGAPIVYWAAPRLSRYATLAVMPLILIAGTIITYSLPPSKEDTFVGRVGLTIRSLADLDPMALIGAKAPAAIDFVDSGYTYLIYATSLLGMLVMWLLFSLASGGRNVDQRRCGLMLSLFVFINLLIAGNAVFTIKIAALIWLLVGFLRSDGAQVAADGEQGGRRLLRDVNDPTGHRWAPS
jgi:hypothetical protein